MKNRILNRLTDITRVRHRAAFADVEHLIKKHKYGSDAFMKILEERYSCHAFTQAHVSASKLEMILDAARMAPTAYNRQPFHIWMVKSLEAIGRLQEVHSCYGAPVVFVVGCRREDAWERGDGRNSAFTDAAIVITHMMLTATDAGLANSWIFDFDSARMKALFPETEGYEIAGLLAVGHPAADEGKPLDLHVVRKTTEELVTEI